MASLPDPTHDLNVDDRALFDRMVTVRTHAEGTSAPLDVYVRLFNNPQIAALVGAFGEHLRFGGGLPDDVRELIILRFAARQGFGYEWSHHVRPARLAGLTDVVIESMAADGVPADLPGDVRDVLEAVDLVVTKQSIPAPLHERIVAAHGNDGIVEVVALCGLYGLMGYVVTAFDIPVEPGFPAAPF